MALFAAIEVLTTYPDRSDRHENVGDILDCGRRQAVRGQGTVRCALLCVVVGVALLTSGTFLTKEVELCSVLNNVTTESQVRLWQACGSEHTSELSPRALAPSCLSDMH